MQGYAEDPRWATLVERRLHAGGFWASVSPWLPRGEYSHSDRPPLFDDAWDYRLKVRDQFGQMCSEQPVISLDATP
jgi:hypothetical protein